MGSGQKETRQQQTEQFVQLKANRRSFLLEKGVAKKELKKDKMLNSLQAQIKRSMRAVDAINAREKVIEKAKQQIIEKKASAKPKQKKQKAEPAPPKKGESKKKKSEA
jgi:hypothetical protein